MRNGYIQVYTGEGKGKTTAALGLALRAAGAGMRVFIGQFLKKKSCCEHKALERFGDLITVAQFGSGFVIGSKRTPAELRVAQKGIAEVERLIASGEYDLVILDEINVAIHSGLVCVDTVVKMLDEKPSHVEIVLTGRHADKRIVKKADLVTEMKEIRHYFKKGVVARKGIEM
jgi:cob(I)alamin adenosyltransferase